MVPAQLVDVGSRAKSGSKQLIFNRAVVSKIHPSIHPTQKHRSCQLLYLVFLWTRQQYNKTHARAEKVIFVHGTIPCNEHLAGGYITSLGEIPAPFVTSSLISRTVCLQQTISEMWSQFEKKKKKEKKPLRTSPTGWRHK